MTVGNKEIEQTCEELKKFLVEKNTSYDGAAFKDSVVGSTTVKAEDAILVRISDKIRRLTSGGDYQGEDTLTDLCGYIILLKSLRTLKCGEIGEGG